ncbi:MAG: hypothetical protein OHK0039_45720 [Bacteroidia bacterium]
MLAIVLALYLTGCQEDPIGPSQERVRTYLRVLNAYSKLPGGVDVRFRSYGESRIVADGVRFREGWPTTGYASLLTFLEADTSELRSRGTIEVLDHSTKEVIYIQEFFFTPETQTTLAVVDSFGKPLVVKTIDLPKAFTPGTVNVRFMNLSSALRSVSLRSADDSIDIDRLNFLNYSSFELHLADVYTFYFINDLTGYKIDSITSLNLSARKSYSFYLTQTNGFPVPGYEILE